MVDDPNKDLDAATRPLDPYNPKPVGPGAYDQYGNARFEPVETAGRGPLILLGILVAVGVIGGLIYFNHAPRAPETAQAPRITDTRPAPVNLGAQDLAPQSTPPSATTAPFDSGAATPAPR